MAALVFTSQVDTVIGQLENGIKVVSTLLSTATNGVDTTQFTIKPLKQIIAFIPCVKIGVAGMVDTTYAAGTFQNQVSINPGTAITGSTIEILSFGY